MTQKTDLNITPYHDDFSEDKNFHKVLFRAGRPLQARELTQSQSILQDQVERFGSHFFKEGSIVQGAETNIDMDIYFVKVQADNPNLDGDDSAESFRESFHGKLLRGKSSGVIAKVITSTAATSDDSLTLFVKGYQSGTNDAGSFLFVGNEELEEVTITADTGAVVDANNNNEFKTVTEVNTPTGRASLADISEGVVYSRGFFIKVDAQKIILEKYSGQPSYRVGLEIKEELISSSNDTTLLDNAQGTNNENAPGADRLKVSLILKKVSITETTNSNFIELSRVNNGIIELQINRPVYSHIERTLARRTFDANGDFVVRQFSTSFREHLKTTNNKGFYTSTNGGDANKFVCQISPGKAYVKGFEIDKIGTTNLTFDKARTTAEVSNASTPVRLGNKLKINDVKALPEFQDSTDTDAFKPIKLYDRAFSGSASVPSGAKHIGFARVRHIDNQANVSTQANDEVNLFLFDIKMFTEITYSAHSGTAIVGDKVTGGTSGATGIIAYDDNSDGIYLHDVVGTFVEGEAITSRGDGDFALSTSQNTNVRTFNISQSRGVFQATPGSGTQNFVGDVVLDDLKTLSGFSTFTSGDNTVSGVGTQFTRELLVGDTILDSSNTEFLVSEITSDISIEVTDTDGSAFSGGTQTQVSVVRKRAVLRDQDQSASIFAWPRNYVDTITPTANGVSVRKQVKLTVSSGNITVPLTTSDEKFASLSNDNFQFAVLTQSTDGSRTLDNGDVLYPDDITSFPTDVTSPLVVPIGDSGGADDDAVILVSYSVIIKSPSVKLKDLKEYRSVKFGSPNSDGNVRYGYAYDHKELALAVPDVYKVHAVLEAVPGTLTSGNATAPNMTITETSGSFTTGEVIIGQTSGARAKIIDYNGTGNKSFFVYLDEGVTFSSGEAVVGQTDSGVATTSNVALGSPNIKNRYFLDNGQRDGFYDVSKLQLKPGEPAPNNPIVVIFDYFTAGAGDYFAVGSYADIDYKDIPNYSPNKVDLGGFEPDGQFELSDAVDFRSPINALETIPSGAYDQTTITDLSDVTTSPFAYETRTFTSGDIATPIVGTTVDADLKFYVPRIDKIFLHKNGGFEVSAGIPDITPQKPGQIDEAIEMFELFVPAFTDNLKEITVQAKDYRRFTMKDIGKINQRVTNLERVTSLSLLEKNTEQKQILDADGLDRFKSGFLVDNFRGHKIGDVVHPDYQVGIDTQNGQLRPMHYTQFFDIEQKVSASTNYKKTGDLITLPFTEQSYVNQRMASRSINVNPYHVFAFVGNVKLSPENDVWQDTENLPEVRVNREGNFDAVLAENRNSLGSVWNAWQTTWVGEPEVTSSSTTVSTEGGSWDGDPSQGGNWVNGTQTSVTREITQTPETQTRTGIRTSVVEEFVESRNDRIVSISVIPFCRARTIEIDAQNLKPGTRHYVYFDGIKVDEYVRPFSSDYTDGSTLNATETVKTDSNGRLRAYFDLPNNRNQRFPTGMRDLRITSSQNNLSNPASYGDATYQAQGLLQSNQTEIVSTRNGRVIIESLSGERSMTKRGENINSTTTGINDEPVIDPPIQLPPPPPPPFEPLPPIEIDIIRDRFDFLENRRFRDFEPRGWVDPLAQSILVESEGGMFVTSIDLYFKTKDKSLPVSVELRNMVNGYPGQIVMPFSTVFKNPADINTSADGSVATTFTFDSPVYVQDNEEFCFVVLSNSNEYEVFHSRMGDPDLITGETISGQPYGGSLFLSQNASTWTAEQTDDLKFNMKVASFNTSVASSIVFENKDIDTVELQDSPVETFSGQTYVKLYNYSHGMYDTNSNVTISGVTGEKQNGVVKIGTPSALSANATANTYNVTDSSVTGSVAGEGIKLKVVVDSGDLDAVSEIYITDPGFGYLDSETLTVTIDTNKTFTVAIDTVDDTLGGMPIGAINATHTAIQDFSIDSFNVDLNTTLDGSSYSFESTYGALQSTIGGGSSVTSTRNIYFDGIHTMIPSVRHKNTEIYASVKRTGIEAPTSPRSGLLSLDTAYTRRTSTNFVKLNDNVYFDKPSVVASPINEQNEMGNIKSFECIVQLRSVNPNVSPVIDVATIGCLGIMNRINDIDESGHVSDGETFVPSTEPEGDNNAMVYVTRKVTLQNPATSLKVFADNFRPPNSDIKLMYKIVKSDEDTPIDDLGFEFFNTDGSSDTNIPRDGRNFKEYEYTADGLPEFSSFVIKIVGQSQNTSSVPIVSALRCIALA